MTPRNVALALIGGGGYIVWAFMAWQDPAQRPDFLRFTVGGVTAVAAIVVRDLK